MRGNPRSIPAHSKNIFCSESSLISLSNSQLQVIIFSQAVSLGSLHPYQTDLWYVFLPLIFFTVVYSLNPSDLFGSLGVNHWTAWWGNSQRPTWNLITKKKIGKNIFPWFWTQVIWNIVNVVNHFFAIRMLVLRFFFLRFFLGFCWFPLIEKTKVQLFQTRFALLSNSFAVYKKKKKNAFRGLKLAWAEKSVALLPAMQWWAWKPRR